MLLKTVFVFVLGGYIKKDRKQDKGPGFYQFNCAVLLVVLFAHKLVKMFSGLS